jgi:type VI secretion system secreted protein Hcp
MLKSMIIRRFPMAGMVLAALLTANLGALAAADVFLKLSGVDGESTDDKHPREIEVVSWSWGITNPGTVGGGSGKAVFKDFSFAKFFDKASPKLMLAVCTGQRFDQAVFTVRRPAADKPFEYLVITLSDVLVSSVAAAGTQAESRPTEQVAFQFTKAKVDYTVQNEDGSAGEVVSFGWDLVNNTEL